MTDPEHKGVMVITGASAGVGRATAHEFARHGYAIGLIGRSRVALEATAREIEGLGGSAAVAPGDVGDSAAIEDAAAQFEADLGPIDIWINNASNTLFAPVAETTAEEFRRITEVTYLGAVHGTLAALRRMRPRNRGTIVQVSSALAYRGIPLQAAYCAGKHALQGFTESLRCELLHESSNVKVTMVHLPALNTPQFNWARNRLPTRPQPLPPIFQPELAGRAVFFAATNVRREISVGGSTVFGLLADRVAPALADRYLAQVAYDAQQSTEPETPGRPDNLYEPIQGMHGVHGRFDDRASAGSGQFWANAHRTQLALAFGAGLAAVLGARWLATR